MEDTKSGVDETVLPYQDGLLAMHAANTVRCGNLLDGLVDSGFVFYAEVTKHWRLFHSIYAASSSPYVGTSW